MNNQKPARVGTCSCGQQFTTTNRHQRSCDACVEARKAFAAAHPRPLRACDECGEESRACHHGICPACQEAHRIQRRRESTPLGEYWEGRAYVMHEIELAKKNNWGEERNDALAMAINGMLGDLQKASRKAHAGEMEIHLLTIACQEGTLTPAQCNDLLDNHKIGTPSWNAIVESVYLEFFGRVLDRKDATQMTVDIEALKAMDKQPYMGDRGQALLHAYNKRNAYRKGHWGKPLAMTDHNWKPKEGKEQDKEIEIRITRSGEDKESDTDEDFLDRLDNLFGGRYGYGVKMPRNRKDAEVGNPEQEPHPDQARIDAAFAAIMKGFEL